MVEQGISKDSKRTNDSKLWRPIIANVLKNMLREYNYPLLAFDVG